MATSKSSKVVQTVRRNGEKGLVHDAKPALAAHVVKARVLRKAARKPLNKSKAVDASAIPPNVEREEPVIYKKDADKPLAERLNAKLLEQLRTRKVTNAAAAQALGVSEIYLSRTLSALGEQKVKGATTAHRESRSQLNKVRTQTREILAKKVNRGEMTIEKAAKEANCSVRTLFRYCAKFMKPKA